MNKLLKKLPFTAKLTLIGLIPFCFLVYMAQALYHEKSQKLSFLEKYMHFITESANINSLITSMQEERKFSFDYSMTNQMRQQLLLQRPRTDSLLHILNATGDPALAGFTEFTKLKELVHIRNRIDSLKIQPNDVMHFYSNTIFRLNTLNTIPPANTPFLESLFEDLAIHKILSEMITYLGIIRSNIYNVLYTKKYMVETLIGTIGTHDVYDSYQAEFMAKASAATRKRYSDILQHTALKPTIDYIDTLFKRFTFDSSLSAAEWWAISDKGTTALQQFQQYTWHQLNVKLTSIISREQRLQQQNLALLVLALLSVILIVVYIVFIISQTLNELRVAAEKIAEGQTRIQVDIPSGDIIGKLATSILIIDKSNRVLADAAIKIGHGDFNIGINPRSEKDELGSALVQMQKSLQAFHERMEYLVALRTRELARSNEDLQQFAHAASHDLKEPLRKVAMFSNILREEEYNRLSEKGRKYVGKIEESSIRMKSMIEGVLAYSTLSINEKPFQHVNLNKIIDGVRNDLEMLIIQKEAEIICSELPIIVGIEPLIQQLFYNLLNNALKFSREGVASTIKIAVSALSNFIVESSINTSNNEYVHLVVEDNGIGFNQADAGIMFNVFSRLNAKEKYEGTGLGLALCKKIVHRHSGDIYAEGERGKGACFHILLPVKKTM